MRIFPFFCCACFRPSFAPIDSIGREATNCRWCKATSRDRAMLLNIHLAFIRKFLRKPKYFPQIVGVSDGYIMQTILKKIYRSNYQNYQYHVEPILDITNPPSELQNSADIISCSEVLEHVAPPVHLAFAGLRTLLRTGGTLVLSVPHTDETGLHIEHFPEMIDTELILGEQPKLIGTLSNGVRITYSNLVFHGGIGSTLEFRVFSFNSLRSQILNSGFSNYHVNRNIRTFGISWENWSRVWIVK